VRHQATAQHRLNPRGTRDRQDAGPTLRAKIHVSVPFRVSEKAAVNTPQSRRSVTFDKRPTLSRQRLDCGGFSTAFARSK